MTIENTFGNINFNGVDLSQNNIFVQHYPLMGAPSRRQTAISGIAHRNAVFDEKEYDNVEVELDFVIVADTFDELSDRRAFLFRTLDVGGYVPVKIDPDPFVYYMYRTSDMKETLFDGNPLNWIRVITVTFSRDPFKYYDVNENRNLFLNSKALTNSYGKNGSPTVTVEPFDSNTNMWHIIAAQGSGAIIGIYLYNYGQGKIPNNSDWSYSVDIKGTGKVAYFGIEDSIKSPVTGTIGSDWSRISQTGHVGEPLYKTIVMYFDTTDSQLDVYIKLPKLETGNKPTDWTPAPEDGIEINTSGTTISNPSNYESLPKITIYANTGTGTTNVNINGVIQLKNVNGNIVLDSMLEDAYWIDGSGNYVNGNSSMVKPYFPKLQPKLNAITFDSTVSKVVITPRWRTL